MARDIDAAHSAGARLRPACETAGIDARTLQRWKGKDGLNTGDGRPQAVRPTPGHALSPEERAALLAVANEPRFASLPPARIVPMLADEGVYLGSASSMARVLKAHGQNARRGRAKVPKATRPPTTHIATAPGQVWCSDMTDLPANVLGRWSHLYLILDLYGRKIVGAEVHDSDDADHAVHLLRRTALAESIASRETVFRDQVRRFCEREITPVHSQWESAHGVRRDVWRRVGENGLLCCWLSEADGGPGGDLLFDFIVCEELGRVGATGLGCPLHSTIVAPYLAKHGAAALKRSLPRPWPWP